MSRRLRRSLPGGLPRLGELAHPSSLLGCLVLARWFAVAVHYFDCVPLSGAVLSVLPVGVVGFSLAVYVWHPCSGRLVGSRGCVALFVWSVWVGSWCGLCMLCSIRGLGHGHTCIHRVVGSCLRILCRLGRVRLSCGSGALRMGTSCSCSRRARAHPAGDRRWGRAVVLVFAAFAKVVLVVARDLVVSQIGSVQFWCPLRPYECDGSAAWVALCVGGRLQGGLFPNRFVMFARLAWALGWADRKALSRMSCGRRRFRHVGPALWSVCPVMGRR